LGRTQFPGGFARGHVDDADHRRHVRNVGAARRQMVRREQERPSPVSTVETGSRTTGPDVSWCASEVDKGDRVIEPVADKQGLAIPAKHGAKGGVTQAKALEELARARVINADRAHRRCAGDIQPLSVQGNRKTEGASANQCARLLFRRKREREDFMGRRASEIDTLHVRRTSDGGNAKLGPRIRQRAAADSEGRVHKWAPQ